MITKATTAVCFLAKTKDKATKSFENFIVYFEKRFSCRIHCLRTDDRSEYRVVDPLCEKSGVRRQVSEAGNQASNGKAERLHETVMHMLHSMIFESGLPFIFLENAAENASYILNRSPTRENENRASPIKVLTGSIPKLTDIVFLLPVHRNPEPETPDPRSTWRERIARATK